MTPQTRRRFSQHFLEDSWVTRIINKIKPTSSDTIIEIGPGRGAITKPLVRSGAKVIAVEIDRDLARLLESDAESNLSVISEDILKLDLESVCAGLSNTRVVGNLPYGIGSLIVVKLLQANRGVLYFRDAVIMLQKEVADRMTSNPGSKDWGPLGIITQLYSEATQVLTLPPGAFRPMPKVTSALIAMRFRKPNATISNPDLFDRMIRAIFTQRRKTVVNALAPFAAATCSLSAAQILERAGIDTRKRPEDLELTEFVDISEVLQIGKI